MVTALAMMFSIMTSYARARAESLIEKCKVGFMERPERIVLFMIGAFTDRMAAVMWVILVLSIVTVANRIHFTYLALNDKPVPRGSNPLSRLFWRAFFWTDERDTLPYDAVGHRHPRLRVADATRLAARPDGLGLRRLALPRALTMTDGTECRRILDAFGRSGPYCQSSSTGSSSRTPRHAAAALPRSRGDVARRHRPAHVGLPAEAASGELHELVVRAGRRRVTVDTMSTWGEHSPDSHARVLQMLARVLPDYRLSVTGPSWWRGDRRVAEACAAQVSLRDVLLGADVASVKTPSIGCRPSPRSWRRSHAWRPGASGRSPGRCWPQPAW